MSDAINVACRAMAEAAHALRNHAEVVRIIERDEFGEGRARVSEKLAENLEKALADLRKVAIEK